MIHTLSLVATICVLVLALFAPLIILAAASLIVPLLAMPWLSFDEKGSFVAYLKGIVICFFALLTLRLAVVSPVAYRMGYTDGVAAVETHIAKGTVHQFAQREKYHMWCLVGDTTAPAYRRFCGFKAGVRESLPNHSGDEQFACEALERLGAVFTKDGYDSVIAIEAKGSSITDANVHWFGAFPFLAEISLDSVPISDDAIKYLISLDRLSKLTIVNSRLTASGARDLRDRFSMADIRND